MTRVTCTPPLKNTRAYLLNFALLLPIVQTPIPDQPLLPVEITKSTQSVAHLLAQQIYLLLDGKRLRYDIDATSSVEEEVRGQEAYLEQIFNLVHSNQPLIFKLVGFPYKSLNTDLKVFNDLPDMAERKAFEQLNSLCAQIKEIYAPGAQIVIISDGHLFCDVFQISDATVETYEATLKKLMADLDHLRLITIKDLMEYTMSYEQFRHSLDQIPLKGETPPHDLEVMKERLHLELQCPLGSSLVQSLYHIAKTLMERSQRFSTYLSGQKSLASLLNLSVHFQKNLSKKMGIHLVGTSAITPWHGVLVADRDGRFTVKHRQDVNHQNYDVINEWVNGVACPYYRRR